MGSAMLLPKDSVTWKSTKARLPPSRKIWQFLIRTRLLVVMLVAGLVVFLWQGLGGTAGEMQR